ncbi:MAG TPA: hypothetical protein VJR89_10470 [Polyangiales bacterium]|nr:hypothetical protein [Polyangiales bacterium]
MLLPRTLGAVLLLAAGACIDLRAFPSESIVDSPRVLAVVAEPPEVTPGHGVTLTPLIAHAEHVSIQYLVCGTFDAPFGGGGAQFGEMEEEECSDGALLRGSGPSWTVPVAATEALWSNSELAETILGGTLPRETIETVRTSVGLPVLVELNIEADDRELRAVKRVLLSEKTQPNANPPRPRFRFGEIDVEPDPDSVWDCRAGQALVVRRGKAVEITPATEDGQEPWVERYPVFNSRGELEERDERAFYSWFASGGEFESHVTRAPLRNQVWTAPNQAGDERIWLVVRDGHGGTSACRFDVRVE